MFDCNIILSSKTIIDPSIFWSGIFAENIPIVFSSKFVNKTEFILSILKSLEVNKLELEKIYLLRLEIFPVSELYEPFVSIFKFIFGFVNWLKSNNFSFSIIDSSRFNLVLNRYLFDSGFLKILNSE